MTTPKTIVWNSHQGLRTLGFVGGLFLRIPFSGIQNDPLAPETVKHAVTKYKYERHAHIPERFAVTNQRHRLES